MISKYNNLNHYSDHRKLYIVLLCFIVILLFYINNYDNAIISTYDNPNNQHYDSILKDIQWNNRIINKLCLFNRNQLKYYIWSHRSYLSKDLIDGSYNVVNQLLTHNIRNFDIDVSCILINNGIFYILFYYYLSNIICIHIVYI